MIRGEASNSTDLKIIANNDKELASAVDTSATSNPPQVSDPFSTNSFLPDNIISDKFLDNLIIPLKNILEPVYVSYPNELLADQIQGISIVLFIMCLSVLMLFVILMFNILILIFADKIQNYFTNKYIVWYIKINRKMIGVEVTFTSIIIIYGLY